MSAPLRQREIRRSSVAATMAAWLCLLNPLATAGEIDFYRDVYPILKSNCIACHNKTTTKAALNMETPEAMRKGGDSGEGVIRGNGAESLIFQAAAHTGDVEMPPKGNKSGASNLTPNELALLKAWIDQGAKSSVKQARRVVWQPLPPGVNPIYSVAMTRDGRFAACGRANQIFVYDLATRRLVTRLADEALEQPRSPRSKGVAHRALVQSLAYSPDGMRLASGSFREVKIWRRENLPFTTRKGDPEAKPVRAFPAAGVVALSLSGDGKLFAAGCADGIVRVWDLAAGKPVIELSGDVETNSQLAALDWVIAKEGLDIAFQKHEVARIEAQNKALDELLKKTNETITTLRKDLVEKQNALKLAADLKDAALSAFKAREIHLKDAEVEAQNYSAVQSQNKNAAGAANAALAKAKDAQAKATADAAETRKVAKARMFQPLAVCFSADTQTVVAVSSDGSLRAWAVASGLPIWHIPGGGATTAASLVAYDDGVFEASIGDGSTTRVSTRSHWALERTLGGDRADSPFVDRVNALRFSPDGKTLAVGGGEPTRSGDISLWDVASGKVMTEWKEKHSDAVLSLDFSPDGKRLASGGADKVARVTDIASGKPVNVFEGHTHHVLGLSFRADGRVLATAGADGIVVVWDMISGERTRKIEGWSKEVTSIQFIGATNQILTSAGDNLIRIVDDGGGQIRAMPKLPDFMQSAASATTASVIIGGGEDSRLRVWNGTTGQELATFGADSNAKEP